MLDTHLDREHTRGWTNVVSLGAHGEDAGDDTGPFLDAARNGGTIVVPPGRYVVRSDVVLPQGTRVRGASKFNTLVQFYGCNGFVARNSLFGAYDITIENLTIQGDGTGALKHGILLDGDAGVNVGRAKLENLVIQGFSGDGIFLNRPIVSQLRNVQSGSNGRHGFNLIGDGTSVTVLGCYASANGADGHHVENNLNYSQFAGCAADANAGAGYNFNAAIASPAVGISVAGCGAEANLGDQFLFTGSQGLDLSGLFVFPGGPPAVGGHFLNLNGVRHCSLSGIFMPQAAPVGKFALFLDSVGGTQFPTNIIGKGVKFSSVSNLNDAYRDLSVDVSPGTDARAIQTGRIYQGSGAPNNANGNNGDAYFRTDTPGVANQRLYVKSAGAWVGVL